MFGIRPETFILLVFLSIQSAHARLWDLNDVTYLYPLPTRQTDSQHLKAVEFFPYSWLSEKIKLEKGLPREEYESLRLVAFRVDPCFRDRFFEPCRRQIRAVWQPVVAEEGSQRLLAVDAAVHAFYDFTAAEFEDILDRLKKLKAAVGDRTRGRPLDVHPFLQGTGKKSGLFRKGIRDLLQTRMKPEKMTRIAFMQLIADGVNWRFQAFDRIHEVWTASEIPLIASAYQDVHNGFDDHGLEGDFNMMPSNPEPVLKTHTDQLFDFDTSNSSLMTSAALGGFLKGARRVESPGVHLPGTIDCLSCHIAATVKAVSRARGGKDDGAVPEGANSYNLKNRSRKFGSTENFRMLGYFERDLQIGDRVIYESAAVAEALNRRR